MHCLPVKTFDLLPRLTVGGSSGVSCSRNGEGSNNVPFYYVLYGVVDVLFHFGSDRSRHPLALPSSEDSSTYDPTEGVLLRTEYCI